MRQFIHDANTLLDHWWNMSWLSWAEPVALMLIAQVAVWQWQEEEAVQRAREEAQRVIEAAWHEEEWRAQEVAVTKWMAGPSKRSTKRTMPRKASKVIPTPEVEMVSNSDSDNTLGVSQSKFQEYKDMWATAKEGNIPAGYVAVSCNVFNCSAFDINNRFHRSLILVCIAPQAATTTHALFTTVNLSASSVPTTIRNAPCSKASCLQRSINGLTLVLPSNGPPKGSVPILLFFGLC